MCAVCMTSSPCSVSSACGPAGPPLAAGEHCPFGNDTHSAGCGHKPARLWLQVVVELLSCVTSPPAASACWLRAFTRSRGCAIPTSPGWAGQGRAEPAALPWLCCCHGHLPPLTCLCSPCSTSWPLGASAGPAGAGRHESRLHRDRARRRGRQAVPAGERLPGEQELAGQHSPAAEPCPRVVLCQPCAVFGPASDTRLCGLREINGIQAQRCHNTPDHVQGSKGQSKSMGNDEGVRMAPGVEQEKAAPKECV